MAEEKKYINEISLKEMVFDDGNTIIAVDVHIDKFIEELKSVHKNDAGYAKFRIVRRKEPTDWGHTHFMSVYVPKAKDSEIVEGKPKKKKDNPHTFIEGGDDDMPF